MTGGYEFGAVFTRCPHTGDALNTGIESDGASLRAVIGIFGRVFCAGCGVEHEWNAAEAWIALPGAEDH